jgi:hypothetical protein
MQRGEVRVKFALTMNLEIQPSSDQKPEHGARMPREPSGKMPDPPVACGRELRFMGSMCERLFGRILPALSLAERVSDATAWEIVCIVVAFTGNRRGGARRKALQCGGGFIRSRCRAGFFARPNGA